MAEELTTPDGATGVSLSARAFIAAIILGSAGGLAFVVAVGLASGRVGGANELAALGMVMLVLAGLSNTVAFCGGAVGIVHGDRRIPWWWPPSLLAMLGCLYGGWVVLTT